MKTKIYSILVLLLVGSLFSIAQDYPLQHDALYWKNRMPHSNYWQQDVYYKMDVVIDEEQHTVGGHQTLKYYNNSPDTLFEIYFHLFQNAFIKGNYAQELQLANKVKPKYGKREAAGLGTTVSNVKIDGVHVAPEIHQTIMKLKLQQPLPPNSAVVIDMDFVSFWDIGSTRRRMKMYDAWGFMHYNGCQWYPKVCVYDAKFGWDTYQHLGKEFYGNFGKFDVTYDFPANYIVEATGVLKNRDEVLPSSLRAQLDLANFKDKKWGEAPSQIIPYEKGVRKKWHFIADHVHDVAFTADPSYRIATTYWNGVECVGLAQEPHAAGWQNTDKLVAKIVENFSKHYGTYHYPKMIAADAADGMEYPMITLDAGRNPGYRGLLVHEIGHNWYYGMIGTNETYRAGMDEGFTQYITAEGLRMLDGDTLIEGKPKGWRARFWEPKHPSDVRVLYPYTYNTTIGGDHQLNTHSDDFNGALHHGGGYSNVYYKSASMLYHLRVVLGDELFSKSMLHFFEQWKFAHPYFEDFRNSIIQYSKVDLNWFFDQWWETTKPLDYGIQSIKKVKGTDSFHIVFKRQEKSMQSPIDFLVVDQQNNKHIFHIPNNWYQKKTEAQILPKWIGWGKIAPKYTAVVNMPSGIKSVHIDTSYMMPDRFLLNNHKQVGALIASDKVVTKLDIGTLPVADRKHYRLYWRPDVWYNGIDGLKLGIAADGSYLQNILKINARVWYNTTLGRWYNYLPEWNEKVYQNYAPINYSLSISAPFSLTYNQLLWQAQSRLLDGFWKHGLAIQWKINPKNNIGIHLQSIYAYNQSSSEYLLYQREWSSGSKQKNNSLSLAYNYNNKGFYHQEQFQLLLKAPIFTSNYNYNYIQTEYTRQQKIDQLLLKTRVFARMGWGNNIPSESALFLSMAAPEQQIENKYTRAQTVIPQPWQNYNAVSGNHFHVGGGMNLRGYAGYYAYDERNGELLLAYKSRSGVAVNAELDFSQYIKFKPKFFRNWLNANAYLFADAGIVELMRWQNEFEQIIPTNMWSDVRVDAGIGFAFTVKKWGAFTKASPLTIRADFPLFLNRPMYGNSSYFDFRWLLGLGWSF